MGEAMAGGRRDDISRLHRLAERRLQRAAMNRSTVASSSASNCEPRLARNISSFWRSGSSRRILPAMSVATLSAMPAAAITAASQTQRPLAGSKLRPPR